VIVRPLTVPAPLTVWSESGEATGFGCAPLAGRTSASTTSKAKDHAAAAWRIVEWRPVIAHPLNARVHASLQPTDRAAT
jgi:hypothetical protein